MAEKITLTEAQIAKFPEYVERYNKIQLSTDGIDFDALVPRTKKLYLAADLEEPLNVVYAESPIVAAVACCFGSALWWLMDRDPKPEGEVVGILDKAAGRAAKHVHEWFASEQPGFDDLVRPEHAVSADDFKRRFIDVTMKACAGMFKAKPATWNREEVKVDWEEMLLRSLEFFNTYYHGGNTWSYSHEHLVAIVELTGLDLGEVYEKFKHYQFVTENGGPRMMHKKFCIISDRPREQHTIVVNGVYRNHNPDGAAMKWADGTAVYFLNGVRVPPWVVLTPRAQLDPLTFKKIQNNAFRDEFIKLVGVDRLLEATDAKTIEEEKNEKGEILYALRELSIGDGRVRPYLQMRNPSTDVYHVEGVAQGTRTIQSALLFRSGLTPDQVDDENGVEWYQQGDVNIFPTGATKFRSRPKILT